MANKKPPRPYIIPVIGSTGAGKSTFINQLLGFEAVKVGYSLQYCTNDLQAIGVPLDVISKHLPQWYSTNADKQLVVVDTPGFDDTSATDSEILKRIADWMAEEYGADAKLAGIICLHEIVADRYSGSRKGNLDAFEKLCGQGNCGSVVLGTTKWGKIRPDDIGKMERRQDELCNIFWKDMTARGSTVQRIDETAHSAWKLVETILNHEEVMKKRTVFNGRYIIPIMGVTGAGKSTFINQLLGREVAKVGYSLQSCTNDLQAIDVPLDVIEEHLPQWRSTHPDKQLVIVDTPGFDDTDADDSEILKRIAGWLAKSYGADAKLAGVIYLHEIVADRYPLSRERNFDVFKKLCGRDNCKSVVLGTTKWGKIRPEETEEMEKMERRQKELRDEYWQGMTTRGSTVQRVDETSHSAWKIVEIILSQDELVRKRTGLFSFRFWLFFTRKG